MMKKFFYYLMSLGEPVTWIIDRKTKTILDVGCGQGLPMGLIKMRMKPKYTVGVDLFKPYIKEAKAKKIHDEYILEDVLRLSFSNKSFDVVMALQVLEHLTKEEAGQLLDKLEKIAKRQVIVATPIGHMHHPEVDGNPLQAHKSAFYPEDFEKKGYMVLKFGRKSILGEHGIVHKVKNPFLRKTIFVFNLLLTPIYYFIQPFSDYHLYAHKNL